MTDHSVGERSIEGLDGQRVFDLLVVQRPVKSISTPHT